MALTIELIQNKSKTQWRYVYLIMIFMIVFYHGFQYKDWGFMGRNIERLFYLYFILYFIITKTNNRKYHFRKEVICLMFFPLMSMVNTYDLYGQSCLASCYAMLGTFTWVIYFLLHKYSVNERTILRAFLFVALLIFILQVVQQFTYPKAWFGIYSEDVMIEKNTNEVAAMRNGIWRFRMHNNAYYTAPILFAMWCWIQKKVRVFYGFIIGVLLISIYLTLTRQVMAACIFTILVFLLWGSKISKIKICMLCLLIVVGLYASYNILFSEMAEKTTEESNENNIRVISALYFFNESIINPIVFLLGRGLPYLQTSTYGKECSNLHYMGLYTDDVGFIGQIYERGFIFVITTYILFYRLLIKLRKILPAYIRMFVLYTGAMSPMIFPIIGPSTIVVWALLLYICDLHINKSSLALIPINNKVVKPN